MTTEELQRVEDLVNEKISEGLPVVTKVMSLEEAKKTGAMALFGEKYGDSVRVVEMGGWSVELCGGTHVQNTSQIGQFKILSENGVAAGVRRIEALTGDNVRTYYRSLEREMAEAAELVKATPATLAERIRALQKELRTVRSENESLKAREAQASLGSVMEKVREIHGVPFLAAHVPGVDMNELRNLGDDLKSRLPGGVVVLISDKDGKVSLVSMVSEEAMAKGAHAGNLVKAIAKEVGGGGGGRQNMAQAGGKNPTGIPKALEEAGTALEQQLG